MSLDWIKMRQTFPCNAKASRAACGLQSRRTGNFDCTQKQNKMSHESMSSCWAHLMDCWTVFSAPKASVWHMRILSLHFQRVLGVSFHAALPHWLCHKDHNCLDCNIISHEDPKEQHYRDISFHKTLSEDWHHRQSRWRHASDIRIRERTTHLTWFVTVPVPDPRVRTTWGAVRDLGGRRRWVGRRAWGMHPVAVSHVESAGTHVACNVAVSVIQPATRASIVTWWHRPSEEYFLSIWQGVPATPNRNRVSHTPGLLALNSIPRRHSARLSSTGSQVQYQHHTETNVST